MKAIVITSPGGPEVLQLLEVEDPEVGDDDVLIRIAAAALNRADTLQRKGLYPPPKGASEFLGLECSGTVEAVGKNVARWKIGDQVNKFEVIEFHVGEKLESRFDVSIFELTLLGFGMCLVSVVKEGKREIEVWGLRV